MFNFWTLFFGLLLTLLLGIRHYSERKQFDKQLLSKGCDLHWPRSPKKIDRFVVVVGIISVLGNTPNIILLFTKYIVPFIRG